MDVGELEGECALGQAEANNECRVSLLCAAFPDGLQAGVHQFRFTKQLSPDVTSHTTHLQPFLFERSFEVCARATGAMELSAKRLVSIVPNPLPSARRHAVQQQEITKCCSSMGTATVEVDYPSVIRSDRTYAVHVVVATQRETLQPSGVKIRVLQAGMVPEEMIKTAVSRLFTV